MNKVNLQHYLSKFQTCSNASAFAVIIMEMLNNETGLTPEEVVKERFISLFLPYAPNITRGNSVSNIRQHINDALGRRNKQNKDLTKY